MKTFELNNGLAIPSIGYGTFRVKESEQLTDMIIEAIKQGYRLIDTAFIYGNEASVGKGITEAIRLGYATREELFITSKVWNDGLSKEEVMQSYEDALARMGLDYLDLYILHWPGLDDQFIEAYKGLEALYNAQKVKAIGVSNFHVNHLEKLLNATTVVPVLNQIEYSPRLTQQNVKQYCESHRILLEAWSPLGNGIILENELVTNLATKHQKTPAQIVLRFDVQTGVITIPKTMTKERLSENLNIFDFELSVEEIEQLQALNDDLHVGPHPDTFDFGR